mgnify:CR=1 FL=1
MTPRIPPKNGSQFQPGQVIRVEFPAQGNNNSYQVMSTQSIHLLNLMSL